MPSPPNHPAVRRSADDRQPDPPSSSSPASTAALHPDALAGEVVDQLAGRIADLISDRVISAVMDTIGDLPAVPTARLVDAAAIAEQFGVARRFVYDHQRELGAVRLGHGPKRGYDLTQAAWRPRSCSARKLGNPGMAGGHGVASQTRARTSTCSRSRRRTQGPAMLGDGAAATGSHRRAPPQRRPHQLLAALPRVR